MSIAPPPPARAVRARTPLPAAPRRPAPPLRPGTRRATGRERLTAATALLALAALVGGLPLLLAGLVGWPLPPAVPTGAQLLAVVRSPITDTLLVKTLACVFWLAWVQVAVCTVVEVRAAVTGVGVPRAVPLAGVTQHLTRRLVGSVLLFTTATAVLAPVGAGLARAGLAAGPQPTGTARGTLSAPVAADGTTAPAFVPAADVAPLPAAAAEDRARLAGELTGRRVLVIEPPRGRHHVTLWELAATHLGDGRRYQEVFALNEGRRQPDGGTLVRAQLIRPGWQLLMPDDAVDVPVVPGVVAHAPEAAPVAPPAAAVPPAPQLPVDPSVAPAPAAPTDGGSGTGAGPAPVPTAAAPASGDRSDEGGISLLTAAELAVLAAGLLLVLARLRTVQQRRRRDGEVPPAPPEQLLAAEVALRMGEGPETVKVLDAALRGLAANRALPDVVAAVVDRDSVRLVLAGPTRPVLPPFAAADPEGATWVARRSALTGDVPGGRPPYPALVSVGAQQRGGQLLLDLEALPVLVLSGARRRTTPVLRALAVELITSELAGGVDLTLVGFGAELTRLQPSRVRYAATLAEALPRLEARVARRSRAERSEVVLVAQQAAPLPEDLQRLQVLAGRITRRSGLSLVTSEDVPGARWTLRLAADGSGVVQPLGATLRSRGLADDSWQAVVDLVALTGAAAVPAELPEEPGSRVVAGSSARPAVRILGPVEVAVDGAGPAPDDECVELVVLLALHPEGLTQAELATALRPRQDAVRAHRATTVLLDRTRRWLGGARLPFVADGEPVRLTPALVLDSEVFRAAVLDGRTQEVLSLLRGPVLSDVPPRRYAWLARTALERGLPALVVDACARLASTQRQAGDPDAARDAAQAGLRVVPLDERLWRELLRAEEAAGQHARVVELGRDLSARLRRELAPYDRMQPETRALLAELRRSRETGPQE